MSELINGRTPEQIKRDLEQCSKVSGCAGCVHLGDRGCVERNMGNALALIKHLEAAQPKWISVEERLPDGDQGLVLVRANGVVRQCQGLHGAYELAEYIPDVDDIPGSWEMWDYHRGEIENLEILSWAPLPTEEDSHADARKPV